MRFHDHSRVKKEDSTKLAVARQPPWFVLLAAIVFSASCSARSRESDSPPQHTAAGNNDSVTYEMIHVPGTTATFPKLTSFRDASIMKRVNDQLDEHASHFKCEAEPDSKGEVNVRASVTYAARDIFSINASAYYECVGAYHPSGADMSLTFDLRTGDKVELEDLFDDYSRDQKNILEIAFADQIERTAKLLASQTESDGSCEKETTLYTVDNLTHSSFSFSFTPGGLQLEPEWPFAVAACSERVTVSYEKLSPFADASGLLARFQ